jgi:hypothetical protein
MQKTSRKKAPPGMYTAQEAIGTIGIPSTTFYSLVNAGEINKIVPAGKKEGFYSKSEIDLRARNYQAFNEQYQNEKLDFGLALIEDLAEIRELTASVSGGYAHAVPEDVLKAWIRRNPQSIHILRKHNEIVGYISMFAIKPDTLIDRLKGRLMNRTIPINDILTFDPNTVMPLYIAEMAVKHTPESISDDEPDPKHPDPQARQRGAKLIRETARFVIGLKKQGTIINQFYAVGTSPFGIQMCRDLGMHPMDLNEGVREDRIPFRLDVTEDSDSILVKRILSNRHTI